MKFNDKSSNCPPPKTVPSCPPIPGTPGYAGPGGPWGPDGPAGAPGTGIIGQFDPNDSCSYRAGQLIFYNGKVYQVLSDCPSGNPDTSGDYKELHGSTEPGPVGPTGPTGPPGPEVPATWNPDNTANYVPGQIIYYNGKLYIVNTNNPQGTPGDSPDYSEIHSPAVPGPTGPTGPSGIGLPTTYDPTQSNNYVKGQIIYYNGKLYYVNTDNPSGTPDTSSDFSEIPADVVPGPTGPTGPDGVALPQLWDPDNTQHYQKGMIVYYNGKFYLVTKNSPQGVPGDAGSDYAEIDTNVVQGPQGPGGIGGPTVYNPDDSGNYTLGQLIIHNDKMYIVNHVPPQGEPGDSPDYTEINTETTTDGPTGPMGATGPTGECYCPDVTINNTLNISNLQEQASSLQNAITSNSETITNLKNQQVIQEQVIADNANCIANIENEVSDSQNDLDTILGDGAFPDQTTYCTGTPYEIDLYHKDNLIGDDHTNTITTPGQATPVGGQFFCTCQVYRVCTYGNIHLDTGLIGTYNETVQRWTLLPGGAVNLSDGTSGQVTAFVNVGGFWQDCNGVTQAFQSQQQPYAADVAGIGGHGTFSTLYIDGQGNVNVEFGGLCQGDNPYYIWYDFLVCPLGSLPQPSPVDNGGQPLIPGKIANSGLNDCSSSS